MNRTKAFFVTQLVLALAGVVCVYWSTSFQQNDKLGTVVLGVGMASLATAILATIQRSLGTDAGTQTRAMIEEVGKEVGTMITGVQDKVENMIRFNSAAYDLGLENVSPALCDADPKFFDQLQHANSVDMMYNTAKNACFMYMNKIEEAIIDHGCRVRILVSSPENSIWQDDELSDGLCPGTNVPGEVNDVFRRLRFSVENLQLHPTLRAGSLEVRTYSCVPTGSIVIIDNRVGRVTPYLPYVHSGDVPAFDITKERGGTHSLFHKYSETFDRVWNRMTTKQILKIDFSDPNSAVLPPVGVGRAISPVPVGSTQVRQIS